MELVFSRNRRHFLLLTLTLTLTKPKPMNPYSEPTLLEPREHTENSRELKFRVGYPTFR